MKPVSLLLFFLVSFGLISKMANNPTPIPKKIPEQVKAPTVKKVEVIKKPIIELTNNKLPQTSKVTETNDKVPESVFDPYEIQENLDEVYNQWTDELSGYLYDELELSDEELDVVLEAREQILTEKFNPMNGLNSYLQLSGLELTANELQNLESINQKYLIQFESIANEAKSNILLNTEDQFLIQQYDFPETERDGVF